MENEIWTNNVSKIAFEILNYKGKNDVFNDIDRHINLGTFFINECELDSVSIKAICQYIISNPSLFFNRNVLIKEIKLLSNFDIVETYYICIKYKWEIELNPIYYKYLVISNVHRV